MIEPLTLTFPVEHTRTVCPATLLDKIPCMPLLDVRSPGEFAQGHVPGAFSMPLLDNDERAIVGTLYKQVGRDVALAKALELVQPKFDGFIQTAKERCAPFARQELALYCWRGGERSASVAWLLEQHGFIVHRLEGGYKIFRRHVLGSFDAPINLYVLGGKTGSGKTDVLHALRCAGSQIIDLEHLARHRGSAFGALPNDPQPTCEHFENHLATALHFLDRTKTVWVEDESEKLGKVRQPRVFFEQLLSARSVVLEATHQQRLDRIMQEYGILPLEHMAHALERIQKRLGSELFLHTKALLAANNLPALTEILMGYYDRGYTRQMDKRRYGGMVHFTTLQETVTRLQRLEQA